MAIYFDPTDPGAARTKTRCDEMGVDIMPVQGPPLTSGGWTTVWLYFWACQPDFVNDAGVTQGGGHFGLQAQDNGSLSYMGVINWGCYDNTPGGGTTFRSTKPTSPQLFDYGNPSSFGYRWEYNHWYRFRVFKSTKQDWLAAQINDGDQPAPYAGSNQRSDETAFSCTVEDITAKTPPLWMFDILVKNAATSKPIANGNCWTEPLDNGTGGITNQTWPYSPICRFRNFIFDGPRVTKAGKVTYYATATHCDCITDSSGYIQMYGTSTLTRTVADGTIVTLPSTTWDTFSNANVGYSSTNAGGTTPRPWY